MNTFVITPAGPFSPDQAEIERRLGLNPAPDASPPAGALLADHHETITVPSFEPLVAPYEPEKHDEPVYWDEPKDTDPVGEQSNCNNAAVHYVPAFTYPGAAFGVMPEKKFAEFMGFALDTVANWRKSGKGPNHTIIGKQIFYQEKEIAAWLDRNTHSTGMNT